MLDRRFEVDEFLVISLSFITFYTWKKFNAIECGFVVPKLIRSDGFMLTVRSRSSRPWSIESTSLWMKIWISSEDYTLENAMYRLKRSSVRILNVLRKSQYDSQNGSISGLMIGTHLQFWYRSFCIALKYWILLLMNGHYKEKFRVSPGVRALLQTDRPTLSSKIK